MKPRREISNINLLQNSYLKLLTHSSPFFMIQADI